MAVLSTHQPPVLVLGMHNSGTSMLAEVIHKGGVFMQANMGHFESEFFTQQVNEGLVMGGKAEWARLPIKTVSEVMKYRDAVGQFIEDYWLEDYKKSGYDERSLWGFKDPRLCVLLPLYLDLFPQAKIVFIRRNPNAIATSLSRKKKIGVGVLPDHQHWRELAIAYMSRAEQYALRHGDCCFLEYEKFCLDPQNWGQKLFSYLGIELSKNMKKFLNSFIYTDGVRRA